MPLNSQQWPAGQKYFFLDSEKKKWDVSSWVFSSTLTRSVGFSGVGVHTGKPTKVRLKPLPPEKGFWICHGEKGEDFLANMDAVWDVHFSTKLKNPKGSWALGMVEHCLSACYALGYSDLMLEVTGEEMPILDGSASIYANRLLTGGRSVHQPKVMRPWLEIQKGVGLRLLKEWEIVPDVCHQVGVKDEGALEVPQHAAFGEIQKDPARTCYVDVGRRRFFLEILQDFPLEGRGFAEKDGEIKVDFQDSCLGIEANPWIFVQPGIPSFCALGWYGKRWQQAQYRLFSGAYRQEIAPARTFSLYRIAQGLREKGLVKGGNLNNALLLDDNGEALNPEGFRLFGECARHKILDMMGDLALMGGYAFGAFTSFRGGHALNNAFVKFLLHRPDLAQWKPLDQLSLPEGGAFVPA